MAADHNFFANLIWQIADLLRGPYRPPQYERVMLPMTVLRRFDCVLAPTKAKVVAEHAKAKGGKLAGDALDTKLNKIAGQRFHNHSPLDFAKLKGDPDNVNKHLVSYIKGFSSNVQRIFEYFEFEAEIERMHEANILYLVVSKFCDVDLHPSNVPNEQMGLIFENLIRRFNELANETAGDHFTPREVIRLMVNLLFIHDDKLLATAGTVRKLLDPACGTGGMLAEAQRYLREHNTEAKLYAYGQDYNKRAFATAASDMLMKEVSHNGGGDNVRFGDIFTEDQFRSETFDYFLSNPPFGVDWKKQQKEIQKEHEKLGFDGRFGAGLPRVNDGALLFLQHMWSKREDVKPKEHKEGSRLAIVFSGSPMFTGGAGSGESEIPAHWDVTRLKFHLNGITQGWSPQCEAVPAGPHDWGVLKAGCVNGATFNEEENKRLPDSETPLPEIEVRPRDVVMSRANTTELVGSAAIVPANVRPRLMLSDKLYRLNVKVDELLPEFLIYFLRAPAGRFEFERTASGASNSMQNISQDVVQNLWLPVPPQEEQRAIVEHIAHETAKLDAVRAATERTIALLKERRSALITAAVTGQLDLTSEEGAAA